MQIVGFLVFSACFAAIQAQPDFSIPIPPVQGKFALHNATMAEIDGPFQKGMLKTALANILDVEPDRVTITEIEEVPYNDQGYGDYISKVSNVNAKRRMRNRAPKPVVNVHFSVTGVEGKYKKLERTIRRSLRRGIGRKLVKSRFPNVQRVTMRDSLYGPACLGLCGDATPAKEGNNTCYCAHDCLSNNDCCASYFSIPCLKEAMPTFAPTPSGWGPWKNGRVNMNPNTFKKDFLTTIG